MSITLDVNAFLNNNEICTQSGCNGGSGDGGGASGAAGGIATNGHVSVDDISMEKEMETSNGNIFDEIEHLLKFNKNLEFSKATPANPTEDCQNKVKKSEEPKAKETFSLDFLTSHTDDFLLASDTQSLMGEDTLLFSVEHDRLQPLSSKFMVPGIYKRIEGVDRRDSNRKKAPITNVHITTTEKTGRIVRQAEFQDMYTKGKYLPKIEENLEHKKHPHKAYDNDNKSAGANVSTKEQPQTNVVEEDERPKEWDALNRLAYDILKLRSRDHIVIDRKRNEIIKTQYGTNQKTIYRLRQPEMLELQPPNSYKNTEANKTTSSSIKNRLHKTKKDDKSKETNRKASKTGKIKHTTTKSQDLTSKGSISPTIPLNHTRTRSGRLVRTPKTSHLENATVSAQSPPSPKESLTEILLDLKDVSYHSKGTEKKSEIPDQNSAEPPTPSPAEMPPSTPPKRKVPPEAICPTCHKIFLGRRMQRHFVQHPDHILVPTPTTNNKQKTESVSPQGELAVLNNSCGEDVSLFRFLVNKLQKSQQLNEDQKADLFLAELNDLVDQLQSRSSRLIRNTSGLHLVSQRCAKLLGIPEGQYALDLTAIEGPPLEPEMQDNNQTNQPSSTSNHLHTRCMDYTNISITLDETLTDEAAQKLNLSAGGKLLPPSEESLLRAVGDLVQTDISKLQTTATRVNDATGSSKSKPIVVANLLPPHIDHVTDNAVEAVHMKETLPTVTVNATKNPLLDLSVDFFQFNN